VKANAGKEHTLRDPDTYMLRTFESKKERVTG